jgi:predicted DNA-binding transcriptional regulator YafY
MAKSSQYEHAQRINAAVELMQQYGSPARAAAALVDRYGISRRQAYRYVQQAQTAGASVAVAEPKLAFTVKLPRSLIQAIRHHAAGAGEPLSQVVTQALRAFLAEGGGRG